MNKTTIGGNKRKLANALAMIGLIIIFIAYMFPFLNQLSERETRYYQEPVFLAVYHQGPVL